MRTLLFASTLLVASALLALTAVPAVAQNYIREDVRIPMREAGPQGLEAMIVRPAGDGRYPLVVLSHGSPRKAEDRPGMTAAQSYVTALEFARRGFAVVAVMRRGYGSSGSEFAERSGPCDKPDYVNSGRTSAQDIKATIAAMANRPGIDTSRIIAVGQSAGGLATVALTADPPQGLVAAINFAGGRGSRADYDVCSEDRLIDAFRTFGKTSRVPMLWVYTANDHFFEPKLAARFHQAFTSSGGNVEFIPAPAFGTDGHTLFSPAGIPQWTPYVDKFLAAHNLTQRAKPAELPPLPPLTPPSQLNAKARESFDLYRRSAGFKAFAVSPNGGYAWRAGRRSAKEARGEALKACESYKQACSVVFVGDEAAKSANE